MKQLLTLILACVLAWSCVDSAYDLSKVNTDDATIGGDESEFKMPLANILISLSQIADGAADLESLLDEARIWLPSPLPGGAQYVDLQRLHTDTAYTSLMLDGLIAQMMTDDAKLGEVSDLVWLKYKNQFLPLLGIPDNPTAADFKAAFKTAFRTEASIRNQTRNIAGSYITEVRVDDIRYTIDRIDIGDEVVDMLANNLDPEGTINPKNTLHLYGEIASTLPVGMRLSPAFLETGVAFSVNVEADMTSKISETPIYADDLRQIVRGSEIVIPVALLKYYPTLTFDPNQKIRITLRLIKRGGLKL